jgi:hypothetical protein
MDEINRRKTANKIEEIRTVKRDEIKEKTNSCVQQIKVF